MLTHVYFFTLANDGFQIVAVPPHVQQLMEPVFETLANEGFQTVPNLSEVDRIELRLMRQAVGRDA